LTRAASREEGAARGRPHPRDDQGGQNCGPSPADRRPAGHRQGIYLIV